MTGRRWRIDQLLVTKALAHDVEHAQHLIEQGLVLVNGAVAMKSSRMVADHESVMVSRPARFVSRGGEKLEGALVAFGVSVDGKRVLDAGASTGGFTDCVLQHGAREVVALDVGRSQLHERLVRDQRVSVVDSYNVRLLAQSDMNDENRPKSLCLPFDVVVADLSFISLQKVATALVGVLSPHGDMILLVKPQFEAEKSEVDKGAGVITSSEIHARTLSQVENAYCDLGMVKVGCIESSLRGADGNLEFLLYMRHAQTNSSQSVTVVG
ncbi:MAG: TlyA family RNA methyltransferase [Actinobacteria bacterium]|nr:MAG: TlyA family RNA methyltransferase [Actinomycetota bacterium]